MEPKPCWIIEIAIKDGLISEALDLCDDLTQASRTETGVAAYHWFFNDDRSGAIIREEFIDEPAIFAHIQTFGQFADRFLRICEVRNFLMLGKASPELRDALGGFGASIYSQAQGFSR